jgi:hypothetical protein
MRGSLISVILDWNFEGDVMASFEPEKQFEDIKARLIEEYKTSLAVKTDKGNELVVHDVRVKDNKNTNDIKKQRDAIMTGSSWNVPIVADLELKRKGKNGRAQRGSCRSRA